MIDRRTMPFLLIAAIAIVLRIAAFAPFAIHHPDEALQYLEQAHRLAFGTGLVPWEYRAGMRSWLVPVLLAGPMALGKMLAPGSLLYLVLARAFAALLAFAPVIAAWAIGRRVSRAHALVAMTVVAIWYESVYFSVHVLTEPLAVAAFLSAAAIAVPGVSRRRLIAGGALLMLAAILRIQYAPAIAVFALVAFRLRWRDWRWLVIGGLLAAAASSAVDIAMGQWPFGWAWANVEQNLIANKAAQFGEFGIEAYAEMLWLHWQVAIVPILWCAIRRAPVAGIGGGGTGQSRGASGDRTQGISLHSADRRDHDPARRDRLGRSHRAAARTGAGPPGNRRADRHMGYRIGGAGGIGRRRSRLASVRER